MTINMMHDIVFFKVTATTEIYPDRPALSLHDALPIFLGLPSRGGAAKDPCKSSCSLERKGGRAAFNAAFRDDKAQCTGTGAAKRQCLKAARRDRKSTRLNSSH